MTSSTFVLYSVKVAIDAGMWGGRGHLPCFVVTVASDKDRLGVHAVLHELGGAGLHGPSWALLLH